MRSLLLLIVFLLPLHASAYTTLQPRLLNHNINGEPDPDLETELFNKRVERSEGLRDRIVKARRHIQTFREHRAEIRERFERQRHQCRTKIFNAEKLDKLDTVIFCYHEFLSVNLDFLEEQEEYVKQLPGISSPVHDAAMWSIDDLIDAVRAINEGIESDVYESADELLEAKRNLRREYREPKWLAMTHLRADRLLNWSSHTIVKIEEIIDSGEQHEDINTALGEVKGCFEELETPLSSAIATKRYEDANSFLRQAVSSLKICIVDLREIYQEKLDLEAKESEL